MLDLSRRTNEGIKIKAESRKRQVSRLEHLYSHKNMARTLRKDVNGTKATIEKESL